ncbi:MAG: hypothetical protein IPF92_07700 [Myxococcales bacterium]|nr:hypothetical protein [Myxococcales bacterium]
MSAPPGASDAATTDVATGGCVPGGVADLSTPPEDLASYCVIDLVDGRIVPKPGVLAYSLNTPLFSDHAIKERTVWVPEGGKATSTDGEAYDFPVGSIITKSFGFADDLRKATPRMRWIETRVMAKTATGWKMNAYTWNDAQTRGRSTWPAASTRSRSSTRAARRSRRSTSCRARTSARSATSGARAS